MKTIIKVFLFLLIIIFIIFVGLYFYQKEEIEEPKLKEEINYMDYTSYDRNFTIRTSKEWKEVKDKYSLNKDAILELYNEKDNAYFLLVINPKLDYKNYYNSYKNEVFKQKEEQYKIKIDEIKKVTVNDYEWQYIDFNYVNNNINTYIRSYAIETTNYYGQIIMWTVASNEKKLANEFDYLIKNFREV